MTTAGRARDSYLAEFERSRASLVSSEAGWLGALRDSAIARFSDLGFPTAKNEDWKYTSVGPIVKVPFRRVARAELSFDRAAVVATIAAIPRSPTSPLLVMVNGHHVAELSCPDNLDERAGHVRPLDLVGLLAGAGTRDRALEGELGRYLDTSAHGFAALNTVFMEDGAVVRLPDGFVADEPIHVLHYSSGPGADGAAAEPIVSHPRHLIVAGAGSAATIVEHYAGDSGATYLTNAVTEIALGRDAAITHCKIQREGEGGFHVHRIQVYQGHGSRFDSHAIALGAALSRTEIHTVLAEERAECSLAGLYVARGRQHVDHHTVIDHARPHTRSRELYKGILDERARGVFTGKVLVRRDAQEISAEQTNKNLLLAEGASVETRPQLEIYADDVRCTHGAAIGRLDEDSLFYMRQRGIDEAQARGLLTYGFANDVLETLPLADVRTMLERAVSDRIGIPSGEAPRTVAP